MLLLLVLICIEFAHSARSDTTSHHSFLDPKSSFRFNFDCGEWGDAKCNAAKLDLAQVGQLIAKELRFKYPVLVCANLSDIPVPPNPMIKSRDVANTTMRKMFSMFLAYNRS